MGIPRILAFPPYRISCRISLVHPPDIAGHKSDILAISIAVKDTSPMEELCKISKEAITHIDIQQKQSQKAAYFCSSAIQQLNGDIKLLSVTVSAVMSIWEGNPDSHVLFYIFKNTILKKKSRR